MATVCGPPVRFLRNGKLLVLGPPFLAQTICRQHNADKHVDTQGPDHELRHLLPLLRRAPPPRGDGHGDRLNRRRASLHDVTTLLHHRPTPRRKVPSLRRSGRRRPDVVGLFLPQF